MKKTKIVCTLGPASADEKTIEAMFQAGMNIGRFNFSHGDHAEQLARIARFRSVRDRLAIGAGVLLDTKGPEIRLRDFKDGAITLEEGATFTLLASGGLGDETQCVVSYPRLCDEVPVGTDLLLNDGKVRLTVTKTLPGALETVVKVGGALSNHKSVNVPSVRLSLPFLSDADRADLAFGVEQGVDFVAASFVRRKEDVFALRALLSGLGGNDIKIISKIESQEGVENFNEIMNASDGIMVARGDMGVEVAYDRLPGLQKRFIDACRKCGKQVITATQMLESMIQSPTPTRAEITDVANAVFDGTSAVMLSGESAMGKYPVTAVQVMSTIATQAERDAEAYRLYRSIDLESDTNSVTNAICEGATHAAHDIGAKAILAVTQTGWTARAMARFRPDCTIIGATPSEKVYHQLSLVWGCIPLLIPQVYTTDELYGEAISYAKKKGYVLHGDRIVITSGLPQVSGATNTLRIVIVD